LSLLRVHASTVPCRQTGSGKTFTTGFEVRSNGEIGGGEAGSGGGLVQMSVKELIARLATDAALDAPSPSEGGADAGDASASSMAVDGDAASAGTPTAAAAPSYLSSTHLPAGVALSASFVEIYQERPRDLLLPEGATERRHAGGARLVKDRFGNYMVEGATDMRIASVADLNAVLQRGAARRAVGSTNMNDKSSRSHAVFTLQLERLVPLPGASVCAPAPAAAAAAPAAAAEGDGCAAGAADGPDAPAAPAAAAVMKRACVQQVSLLRFVDLAGSERLAQVRCEARRRLAETRGGARKAVGVWCCHLRCRFDASLRCQHIRPFSTTGACADRGHGRSAAGGHADQQEPDDPRPLHRGPLAQAAARPIPRQHVSACWLHTMEGCIKLHLDTDLELWRAGLQACCVPVDGNYEQARACRSAGELLRGALPVVYG